MEFGNGQNVSGIMVQGHSSRLAVCYCTIIFGIELVKLALQAMQLLLYELHLASCIIFQATSLYY